jgi:hypothetical protein
MKYQKGDLLMWKEDNVINRNNRERYMIIIQHEPYVYRYIDTGREDRYIDELLEQATEKVG